MTTKFTIEVRLLVEVELDEVKFTEEWMADFRRSFYPFDTVQRHAEHLAQLEARGILRPSFIEGYGPAREIGLTARIVDTDMETKSTEQS